MQSVIQAEQTILTLTEPLDSELDREFVDLLTARQRILATDITGNLDFPYWDNSAMDGYAVRFEDMHGCNAANPAVLEVVCEISAGTQPTATIEAGQAARIFTGSMMPPGADTVVMQEQTRRQGMSVHILQCPAQPQAFVRPQAAYYRAGTPLLAQGTVLNAPEIAVLATVQCHAVPVYRRPVVALLSTGTELVDPDQSLKPGQIVDSNRYALAALVQQSGAVVKMIGTVGDRPQDLKVAIEAAIATADVVISSGGVSVGDYDYVDQTLAVLGAKVHIRAVAVKPGKPLTFATFPPALGSQRAVMYFGLPGNPVSALVSFWRFVQPALRKCCGLTQDWGPRFVAARSRQDLRSAGKRETYLWGQLQIVAGGYEFELAGGSHSSGNLMNLAYINGLAVLNCEQPQIKAGETVSVLQIQ